MKFDSISSFNEYTRTKAPKHDFIDIGSYSDGFLLSSPPIFPNFYRISIKYGLEEDKEKSYMYFSSPNQPIEWSTPTPWQGFYINIAEDLISNNQHLEYSFLSYGLHEPLHLEKAEEKIISYQYKEALHEYSRENFSQDLVLAYCNVIFAHVAQIYKRLFGERKELYNRLVKEFFASLENYYEHESSPRHTVQPSVNFFASQLNVTPNYLSDVIKYYTGKPALEHIHQHIIQVAKSQLDQRTHSIKEISYNLGFEYPNYFSRLFRKVTGVSPSHYTNQ